MNRDVVSGNIIESQTLNRYAFVNGNPISYHDPFGLAREAIANSKVSLMDMLHVGLDMAGMLPVIGEVADGLNAVLYLAEGDYTNALLSGMAMTPVVGNASTVAKYADNVAFLGKKGYNKGVGSSKVVKNDFLLPLDLQYFAEGKKKTKKKRLSVKEDPYQRPSGFRKGVRESVFNNAKDANGRVFDVQSGKEIKFTDSWDMGHLPGYEFRKHRASAQKRQITRKQFLNEHNDPSHYRPELPSSNRNHSDEAPDDIDFWSDID